MPAKERLLQTHEVIGRPASRDVRLKEGGVANLCPTQLQRRVRNAEVSRCSILSDVRDEHYSPFKGPPPDPQRPETVTVFVMARLRGDETDSMRGSVRPGPHGVEAVYTLKGELYRAEWFASEALALRRPGDAAGRARRRLNTGPVSAVTDRALLTRVAEEVAEA
jgi:hypothetical protein